MKWLFALALVAGCNNDPASMNGGAVCGMAPCGGDLSGAWKPSVWCGDPAASGRCTGATPAGSISFAADKSYTALLQLDCPSSGASPFSLGYCVSGNSLVLGDKTSSLGAVWIRQ